MGALWLTCVTLNPSSSGCRRGGGDDIIEACVGQTSREGICTHLACGEVNATHTRTHAQVAGWMDLQDVFKSFDLNHDGTLDSQELATAVASVTGDHLAPEQLEEMMNMLDQVDRTQAREQRVHTGAYEHAHSRTHSPSRTYTYTRMRAYA